MGSKSSTGSAVTAPKGRATRARTDRGSGRSLFTPAMQWLLVVLLGLAIIGAILYLGRDVGSNLGGHTGAPDVVVELDADPAA